MSITFNSVIVGWRFASSLKYFWQNFKSSKFIAKFLSRRKFFNSSSEKLLKSEIISTSAGTSAEIFKVAEESYRVLKKDKFCAVLMGDTRKNGMVQPLAFETMTMFRLAGFKLKEIIIPDSVTAIGYNSFAHCSSVERILIGEGVKIIPQYSLSTSSTKLKSIYIPGTVTQIDTYSFSSNNASITSCFF